MKNTRALLLFFIGFLPALGCVRSSAALPPRSISTSRQFIVYGTETKLRGAICDLAEQAKTATLRLLQQNDAWKTPIIVNAQYAQANHPELPPAHLAISQTGAGLKLQLDLTIAADVNVPSVKRELLRAIYLEMMYRQQPGIAPGAEIVQPPDWLLEGTLARTDARDAAPISAPLRNAAASGTIPPLSDFLRQRPELMEAPWREIYRAYSAILLNLLIENPEGRSRLAHFVADLPRTGREPAEELRAHFPVLGANAAAMEKAWNESVMRSSPNERFRVLSCAETESRLAETLRIKLNEAGHDGVEYSLEEFPEFVRRPDSPAALKSLAPELVALSARANPLYLPIILDYEKIALQLARRKTKRLAQRLAEMRARREQISRTMQTIDDYMNWFEATQSPVSSGLFRDYLRTADQARLQKPPRHDRISIYLDAIETMTEH